jgi:hypothetical protein
LEVLLHPIRIVPYAAAVISSCSYNSYDYSSSFTHTTNTNIMVSVAPLPLASRITRSASFLGLISLTVLLSHHVSQAFVTPSHRRGVSFESIQSAAKSLDSRSLPSPPRQNSLSAAARPTPLWAQIDDFDDEGEEKKDENPYQDPNYPDLEFVDYSDPEYQVDQGVGDEFFDPSSTTTEAQLEAMREERRERNDEFQFETYYKEILKEGQEFKGEWMVYHTSTFTDGERDDNGRPPRLTKGAGPIKVITRGERVQLEPAEGDAPTTTTTTNRLEYQRILHHEKVFTDSSSAEEKTTAQREQEILSMDTKYWPEKLSSTDFRGHQGIMCVGNAYTICTATPLLEDAVAELHEGPFGNYRVELGLLSDTMRFRIKADYSVLEEDKKNTSLPPLHLKSFTVCRETLGMWPRAENYKSAIEAMTQEALWGPRGAHGGLYDPPPVGSEQQASQYLLLDLEGRATVLLPYLMDQDPEAHPDSGWVISLDWAPGMQRYQVDRKTNGGKGLLGLRTLELSEVQSADADTYRPRDGGRNMRQ